VTYVVLRVLFSAAQVGFGSQHTQALTLPVLHAGGDPQACPGLDFTVLGSIFTGLRTVSFCRGLVASRTAGPVIESPDQRLEFS
jgi:hypothetical protein